MQIQITFHDVEPSDAVSAYVRRKAAKLETVDSRVLNCRVAVEAPHRHHQHGHGYRVRVVMHVPKGELVTSHGDGLPSHTNLYAAIDDTFDNAVRVLREHVRQHRSEVRHDSPRNH